MRSWHLFLFLSRGILFYLAPIISPHRVIPVFGVSGVVSRHPRPLQRTCRTRHNTYVPCAQDSPRRVRDRRAPRPYERAVERPILPANHQRHAGMARHTTSSKDNRVQRSAQNCSFTPPCNIRTPHHALATQPARCPAHQRPEQAGARPDGYVNAWRRHHFTKCSFVSARPGAIA